MRNVYNDVLSWIRRAKARARALSQDQALVCVGRGKQLAVCSSGGHEVRPAMGSQPGALSGAPIGQRRCSQRLLGCWAAISILTGQQLRQIAISRAPRASCAAQSPVPVVGTGAGGAPARPRLQGIAANRGASPATRVVAPPVSGRPQFQLSRNPADPCMGQGPSDLFAPPPLPAAFADSPS